MCGPSPGLVLRRRRRSFPETGLLKGYALPEFGERLFSALGSMRRPHHRFLPSSTSYITMLGGSDRMGALRLKLRETGFTNGEEDNATFTFTRREIGMADQWLELGVMLTLL
ncbi:hypothetical protein L914_00091 [Phytophthora nicotianae]|uniref:Uncharacterized protein n=1 Tax=Phytophthora nicotianae TaxID=4792 RepID=W2P8M6_PHYNI|nr:hypothetical protein L914_00091 [Phytophthora nicotianae]